ncbi:hypothetical protein AVEN_212110-1 [Araneus ventricosus]|uniref:Uncharacterized protein n=1 Tax=Araneus ventricosus TaxID=182803 RepID=A0A4Y2REL7_ARAVE|nr:hypothetical protein AVEN_212110-1 [Araneus ventricosus]
MVLPFRRGAYRVVFVAMVSRPGKIITGPLTIAMVLRSRRGIYVSSLACNWFSRLKEVFECVSQLQWFSVSEEVLRVCFQVAMALESWKRLDCFLVAIVDRK